MTQDSRLLLRQGERARRQLRARHPLAEYANDYRSEDYWTMLRAAASDAGVPETTAGKVRLLGCGRMHAKTVGTNLICKGLAELRWDEGRREWLLRATPAGLEALHA